MKAMHEGTTPSVKHLPQSFDILFLSDEQRENWLFESEAMTYKNERNGIAKNSTMGDELSLLLQNPMEKERCMSGHYVKQMYVMQKSKDREEWGMQNVINRLRNIRTRK